MVNDNNYVVADLIADWLEKNDIKIVFGIIGSANSYIFNSIVKKGFTKIVYMHHEQSVVMAAGSYYRSSGKISAALVTAGAGVANAVTGALSNWADSIPCIILSGQESSFYFDIHSKVRMLGTQGIKITDMVKSITKYSTIVTNKDLMLDSLEQAKKIYNSCSEKTKSKIYFELLGQDLRSFIGIMNECDAIIGNDGGAINMAKALNKPSFIIFSPWIEKKMWATFEDGKNHCSVHLKDFEPALFENKTEKELKKEAENFYQKFTPKLIIPKLTAFSTTHFG